MTTPNFGLRKPSGGSAFEPDVDIAELADDTDAALQSLKGPLVDGVRRGLHVGSTNASGDVYVQHGLGASPSYVNLTMRTGTGVANTVRAYCSVVNVSTTQIHVRVWRNDGNTGAPFSSNPVQIYWEAVA